jgi:hypothetical protein
MEQFKPTRYRKPPAVRTSSEPLNVPGVGLPGCADEWGLNSRASRASSRILHSFSNLFFFLFFDLQVPSSIIINAMKCLIHLAFIISSVFILSLPRFACEVDSIVSLTDVTFEHQTQVRFDRFSSSPPFFALTFDFV